jgi:hypothetical protein
MSELTDVLHRIVDRLGLHPDTAAASHEDIDGLLTENEKAAKIPVNPYLEVSDQALVDAAVGGDEDAQAEYRRRKTAAVAAAQAAAQ